MESFTKSVNFFGNTNPDELLKEYGSPLYVYNESVLRDRMTKMTKVVTKYPFTANFSVKANTNPSILKMALECGMNADAMSPGEILTLEKAGFPREKIFFVPNNVSAEELQFAIDRNIITSLDSLSQLELFGKLNKGGRCAVRLNPGVGAGHHEKVVTAGKNTKFGIAEGDIDQIFEVASKYDLHIVGINQHVGSLYMTAEPFLKATKALLGFAEKFTELEFIDFGGGFGIPYHKLADEQAFDVEACREQLEAIIDEYAKGHDKTPLFKSEPGRFVCAEGGVLLGQVYSKKHNAEKAYVGTDIGMNVLVRPSMYDSWHDIEVYRNGDVVSPLTSEKETVSVTGNICESGDLICKERELPVIEEGDVICVLDAGAYGYSMCSNYNSRLRPAEVMVMADGSTKLIRRRDTYEDLLGRF
ncbi:MAG: diaminopimelate decarboxylase [Lachnospiraceae bacterium]|nr:diaminopimelate decarboxylase [Lachnospiraceae bacterium]